MPTYVSGTVNSIYLYQPDDIRVNMATNILGMKDGSLGGGPIDGIAYGLPDVINALVIEPSGVEGYTLQRLMSEFPQTTRIARDKYSIGAQIMRPFSRLADEILEESTRFIDSRHLKFYPLYEQGVVHEYNFADANDLHTNPSVSGRLGDYWFKLPITKSDNIFWTTNPTRLETTNSEVSGLDIVSTVIGSSGLNQIYNGDARVPIYGRVMISVSGASQFDYTVNDNQASFTATVFVNGFWPQDDMGSLAERRERITINRNGIFKTTFPYRNITEVEAIGLPSGTRITLNVFDFNSRFRLDPYVKHTAPIRGAINEAIFWQLVKGNDTINSVIQTEVARTTAGPSDIGFIAKTRANPDTMYDNDLEFEPLDFWQLSDTNGIPLSGLVDIRPVPATKYLFALDSRSNCYVFDTFQPTVNMYGFSETTESPVRILLEPFLNRDETANAFTLSLSTLVTSTAIGIQRWKWSVNYNGTFYNLTPSGTFGAYSNSTGWTSRTEGFDNNRININVSGMGSYVFELICVDDYGNQYKTYHGYNRVRKNALAKLPIRGLSVAPSGIDFDHHGRPWVKVGSDNAVRLVMRTDIGIWLPDERVLITREPYDEVRKY